MPGNENGITVKEKLRKGKQEDLMKWSTYKQ